jgi:hypothetical protein
MIAITGIAYGPFSATSTPAGAGGQKTGFVARAPAFRERFSPEKIFRNFGSVTIGSKKQLAEGQPVKFVAALFRSI